ncbi:hypothetical protein C0585_00930 [Candidatus Woesearchaeota archaeon]|uniref:hypothetical protein n=1 Tax=uncultured Arcobacter sp. TaxID=165434 RepID=UPI000CB11A66|nr:hypothetical protein [uncultured Arcobacter sp.]PLW80747.1 MAG: hypothetical protein C0585_00930 [Candidatus Woesearchaeota archaeon]
MNDKTYNILISVMILLFIVIGVIFFLEKGFPTEFFSKAFSSQTYTNFINSLSIRVYVWACVVGSLFLFTSIWMFTGNLYKDDRERMGMLFITVILLIMFLIITQILVIKGIVGRNNDCLAFYSLGYQNGNNSMGYEFNFLKNCNYDNETLDKFAQIQYGGNQKFDYGGPNTSWMENYEGKE